MCVLFFNRFDPAVAPEAPTLNDFVIRACVIALRAAPTLSSAPLSSSASTTSNKNAPRRLAKLDVSFVDELALAASTSASRFATVANALLLRNIGALGVRGIHEQSRVRC